MATKSRDGYTVLIKQKKLPLSLLKDEEESGETREFVESEFVRGYVRC